MRPGHTIHVIHFAAGSFLSVIALAIPGSNAALFVGHISCHWRIAGSQGAVWPIGAGKERFSTRHSIGNAININWWVIAWAVIQIIASRFLLFGGFGWTVR